MSRILCKVLRNLCHIFPSDGQAVHLKYRIGMMYKCIVGEGCVWYNLEKKGVILCILNMNFFGNL